MVFVCGFPAVFSAFALVAGFDTGERVCGRLCVRDDAGVAWTVEIAFTLLLQNLLQIPLLCLLAAIACDISLLDQKEKSGNLRVKARRCRIGSPQSTGQYLLFSFCVLLILIFSWLLEAFLSA